MSFLNIYIERKRLLSILFWKAVYLLNVYYRCVEMMASHMRMSANSNKKTVKRAKQYKLNNVGSAVRMASDFIRSLLC